MMPSTLKPGTLDAAFENAFAATAADACLVDGAVEIPIPQHGIVFGAPPAVDVPSFMLPSLTAAARHYMQYVKDDVVITAPELQPAAPVDEHIELQPIAPAIERAIGRLMGDIGQLRYLADALVERLERTVRPAEVERLATKRAADRVRHGESDYVVALDNAGERVVDISTKIAAILTALEV